jgi:rhodanese-related sulfurtransferase
VPFLAANKDKELILYCASGIRSGRATLLLRKEGFRTANLGASSAGAKPACPLARRRSLLQHDQAGSVAQKR